VTVITLVFTGKPRKDGSDKTSQFLGIQIPQSSTPEGTLNISQVGTSPKASPAPKATSKRVSSNFSGPQVVSRPKNVLIPPGSMVEAVLVSGASDGLVKAELKEPLIVAGETLLGAGTVLMGSGQSGEDRLMIHFRKAVFRDGTFVKVEAQAADSSDKIPGIKGSRVGYRTLKLAAGVGLSFASGLSQGLQDTQGQMGAVVTPPTMKNALLNGAARSSIEEGQEMMNDYRSERPVIAVEAGTPIFILFDDGD
jgi:type IV secretory pathway VirB10-like protein